MSQLFAGQYGGTFKKPFVGEIFDQGKWWKEAGDEFVPIETMTKSHRLNVARMLLRNAGGAAWAIGFRELSSFADAPDDVVDYWFRDDARRMADPQKWMRSTKLYRALTKDLKVDALIEGAP